jgi:3-oxoacyl-[acyl-carrier protein] reductase
VTADAFDLTGRAAIVTGAGSGIGRATAHVLAGAGAAVVCADIVSGPVEETAKAIVDAGGRASAQVTDVSRKDEVDALVVAAADQFGRLDVMCNIAGIILNAQVVDLSEEDLDRVLAVNLKGVFFGCQAAARVMVGQGSGSIVNMASTAIDTPTPTLAAYGMAKAAVTQLTRVLAVEVARKGVRVNAIAPGYVVTGMTGRHYINPDGSVDEARKEETLAPFRKMTPLGIVGEPEDIAWAVLYLASDASRFVTGQILRPNGGASMPW